MIADTVFIPLGYSHIVLWLHHLATFCTELCMVVWKGGQVIKQKNIVRIGVTIAKYCQYLIQLSLGYK